MKLSDAMYLGSMLRPQGFGADAARPGAAHTCALGAAAEAMGIACGDGYRQVDETWPVAAKWVPCPCPDGPVYGGSEPCHRVFDHVRKLRDMIWHLNDAHEWTREQIADWVATIEATQEATQEAAQLAVEVA